MSYLSEARLRYLWRTKYPWILFLYIVVIGLLRGLITRVDPQFGLNLLMAAAFTSYVFLYIFYIFGVRPVELDYHFKNNPRKAKKR